GFVVVKLGCREKLVDNSNQEQPCNVPFQFISISKEKVYSCET
ncbi:2472_t:CDS:1, partial [Gigaspora margarita]